MRDKFRLSAAALLLGALLVTGEVNSHNPTGVPVATPAPLSCTTPSGAWTITLVPETTGGGVPFTVPCVTGNHIGQNCSKYKYAVFSPTGASADHVTFAISADQDLDVAGPSATVTPPGTASGDVPSGNFLANARHEYPIRINPTPNVPAEISILGQSRPRITTVLVKKGNLRETCLIAGPGVAGDPFQPIFQSQTALVAGGKCQVNLTFDAGGNVIDVNPAAGSSCIKYEGPVTVTIGSQTGPLKNNAGPHGITFGNGTTTCYGPPVPSVPKCICTALPCP
jgi:hypothetical protein